MKTTNQLLDELEASKDNNNIYQMNKIHKQLQDQTWENLRTKFQSLKPVKQLIIFGK